MNPVIQDKPTKIMILAEIEKKQTANYHWGWSLFNDGTSLRTATIFVKVSDFKPVFIINIKSKVRLVVQNNKRHDWCSRYLLWKQLHFYKR